MDFPGYLGAVTMATNHGLTFVILRTHERDVPVPKSITRGGENRSAKAMTDVLHNRWDNEGREKAFG